MFPDIDTVINNPQLDERLKHQAALLYGTTVGRAGLEMTTTARDLLLLIQDMAQHLTPEQQQSYAPTIVTAADQFKTLAESMKAFERDYLALLEQSKLFGSTAANNDAD